MFHDLKNTSKKNLEKGSLEMDFSVSSYLIILFFALFCFHFVLRHILKRDCNNESLL